MKQLSATELVTLQNAYSKIVCESHEFTNQFGYARDEDFDEESRPKDEFQKEVMFILTSPEFEDYIDKVEFEDDRIFIKFDRQFNDNYQETMSDFDNRISKLKPRNWEFGSWNSEYGELEYIKKGGKHHDGGTYWSPNYSDGDLPDSNYGYTDESSIDGHRSFKFEKNERMAKDILYRGYTIRKERNEWSSSSGGKIIDSGHTDYMIIGDDGDTMFADSMEEAKGIVDEIIREKEEEEDRIYGEIEGGCSDSSRWG